MKNAKQIALSALAAMLSLTSCDKDDVNNIPEVTDTNNIVKVGSWKVTQLEDSGIDETADFAGYSFTFADNGQLTATNGTISQTGRWAVRNDRDRNDKKDDVEFTIAFPVAENSFFDELNEDWDIVSVTDTRIELIDKGDANEADDTLVLEQN